MFAHDPGFYRWGRGGGGWSMLLPHYRSQDYYVKYVHNHYLQILLDTGLPGFILFSAILGIFATAVWKSRKLFGNKNGNLLKG
ncbi:O-antigen ligase family protein [Paenibacillus sp. P26]|nr:O-antigen ligase family protein [Paenibacillus sp. P26]